MIRKYHTHKLQTNPWQRDEEPQTITRHQEDKLSKATNSGWSEALLVAHTTLLEISCHGSNVVFLIQAFRQRAELTICIREAPKRVLLQTVKLVSEYDQEIPHSQTADKPMATRRRATNNHETPGRQTKQSNQLSLPHQDDCKTRRDIK